MSGNVEKKCVENNKSIDEELLLNEVGEIEAAEKVINSMLYYRRHVFLRLKRQADAVKFVILISKH